VLGYGVDTISLGRVTTRQKGFNDDLVAIASTFDVTILMVNKIRCIDECQWNVTKNITSVLYVTHYYAAGDQRHIKIPSFAMTVDTIPLGCG
jgi:hypothetical protein